jgi:3',5'-cyclic AMP phosphodiesterase CpdA
LTFTLAHISDVHLPLQGVRLVDLSPKRLLGWLNWHQRRNRLHRREVADQVVADIRAHAVDHVLVSGDLTNIGTPAELGAALLWLQALGPPDWVTAIPGNHDVYGRMLRDPGLARWQQYMSSNVAGLAFCTAGDFPFVRVLGPVALVGTSSAVATPPLYASGRLGPQQTARLAEALTRLRNSGLARVVAIHHAPVPGLGRTRGLEDAGAVGAAIATAGADLVVHGHHHRFMLGSLPRTKAPPIPVVGVASASAAPGAHDPAAAWHRYRFDATGTLIEATAHTLTGNSFTVAPIGLPALANRPAAAPRNHAEQGR